MTKNHPMTAITLSHVYKQFPQAESQPITAIEDVSFKVSSGDVLAILGPSGCGKSTLLRLIAGLETPDRGEILYDNVPLDDIPLQERGIGMVFQSGALMPHWEAQKTVGFFLWLRKRQEEVPARVARISQITGIGLEKLMDRRPSQLSGGERQRVAIARALARDPRVFLFDEPFSSLDAKLRGTARLELKRLLREFPVTSLYVTHDQIEAVAMAHRVAVMREGHIEQIGDYQTLYHNPLNLFVATFVGVPTINVFHGRVRDGQWHGTHFGGVRVRADLPNESAVVLGIRPEFVHPANGDDTAQGRVIGVTPFFAERYQLVEVERDKDTWSLTVPLDYNVRVGERIGCSFDAAGYLFFDAHTGKRIG